MTLTPAQRIDKRKARRARWMLKHGIHITNTYAAAMQRWYPVNPKRLWVSHVDKNGTPTNRLYWYYL